MVRGRGGGGRDGRERSEGTAMHLLDWRVRDFWWWGGLGQQTFIEYYERLAIAQAHELGDTARAVSDLLELSAASRVRANRPRIWDVRGIMNIYPRGSRSHSPLKVSTLSPWGRPILSYTRQVAAGIERGGRVRYAHHEANLASIGLLVEYGEAQAILGGDMEERNWKVLSKCKDCPPLRPSVVKVSHHGSRNGTIWGMWQPSGFFGQRGKSSIAVITPWRPRWALETRRTLPDGEGVINEIRNAGFTVYLTGQPRCQRVAAEPDSVVHVRVERDGTARVQDSRYVKVFGP